MILAAGRGERMGALTQSTPKPLLRIGEHYLIEYAIASLRCAGIREVVMNISYHADQIKAALGNGQRYGVDIVYSEESERLETGGGIVKALPLLGDQPFVVMGCDIVTDFSIAHLPSQLQGLAHLVLVENPSYHAHGDFGLQEGIITRSSVNPMTFASIGVYHPDLFALCEVKRFRLADLLFPAIAEGAVTGEVLQGIWYNVGDPSEYQAINACVREHSSLRPQ